MTRRPFLVQQQRGKVMSRDTVNTTCSRIALAFGISELLPWDGRLVRGGE
jgi:hypothetical protein